MSAAGFSVTSRSRNAATLSADARSVLVSSSRSATATCFTASKCSPSWPMPNSASTVVTTPSRRKRARTQLSCSRLSSTGAGSAMPVVSMTTRSNGGMSPFCRAIHRFFSVGDRLPEIVQQTQPPESSASGPSIFCSS